MLVFTRMKKTFSKNEISAIALEIAVGFSVGENATIVALSGDLGAGKTTLTQSISRELGIHENVISPTFVIMKSYKINTGKHEQLIHIDAYRLNSAKELITLGWQEIISDPKNLVLIEWPERVEEIIPKNAQRILLSHKSEDEREIDF